ncbi:terminase small subunit [Risungbinella massiliensis]|uniref:terminase small subunit n=1 Tax=Risungbinella massiliensis TaxID=1329796 RepID=UPI0005CB990C|nr:terminase small subunit [Risungbinella massiliensis]
MSKLTSKQKAFCDYYIETGNAAESAIKAGYSKKTAKETGYENLTKPHLKKYIEEKIAQKDRERIASQDEVLEFLTLVLRGEITEQIPVVMEKDFEMVDKQPNIRDRTKAAELLGKRYALFKENVNHSGDVGISISVDYGDD